MIHPRLTVSFFFVGFLSFFLNIFSVLFFFSLFSVFFPLLDFILLHIISFLSIDTISCTHLMLHSDFLCTRLKWPPRQTGIRRYRSNTLVVSRRPRLPSYRLQPSSEDVISPGGRAPLRRTTILRAAMTRVITI